MNDAKFGTSSFEPVIAALRERALSAINFAALASEFGLSPATLRRRFVRETGISPKVFQLRIKINRAKEMLAMTDKSIAEIAAFTGFEDSFYFSRLFNDREHCSPTAFRKRNAKDWPRAEPSV